MDTSSALANKSAALAEEAGRVFVEISDSATLAADRVRDIATATREQNTAGHGIAGNVEKVARMRGQPDQPGDGRGQSSDPACRLGGRAIGRNRDRTGPAGRATAATDGFFPDRSERHGGG